MIKKTTKRILIILFAILLYMAFFKITEVNAMSVDEAKENMCNLAKSFQSKKCIYDASDETCYTNRAWTYNNMKPDDNSGKEYIFDCVGFVTYVIHYGTGLPAPGDTTGNSWPGSVRIYISRWIK